MEKVNLARKLSLFDEHWSPRIVGELNGQEVRLAKVSGEFIWHKHDDADEFFMVVDGHLTIHLRDRTVEIDPGEFFIVPRGVEHKPAAATETHIMMFEPAETLNTGDAAASERTVTDLRRI